VRAGSEASLTTAAHPDQTLRGRVSYIDPQVSTETRTAKVRAEVPNPRDELRLGMHADVVVTGAHGASTPRVPRSALQNVGDRPVVYLANSKEPGKFIEREVRLGQTSGAEVEVASGAQPTGTVVFTLDRCAPSLRLVLVGVMKGGCSSSHALSRGPSTNLPHAGARRESPLVSSERCED
jgi:membrane fusion protein, copper/silver efflux system